MSNVRYICLEGGGGRGTVYLGVLKALEDKGLLPLPRLTGLATKNRTSD